MSVNQVGFKTDYPSETEPTATISKAGNLIIYTVLLVSALVLCTWGKSVLQKKTAIKNLTEFTEIILSSQTGTRLGVTFNKPLTYTLEEPLNVVAAS